MNESLKQNLHGKPASSWHAPENLFWVRDENLILLINERRNNLGQLEKDAAIVWGWLNAGISFSKCSHMLAVLKDTAPAEAGIEISGYIRVWQEAGWLEENK